MPRPGMKDEGAGEVGGGPESRCSLMILLVRHNEVPVYVAENQQIGVLSTVPHMYTVAHVQQDFLKAFAFVCPPPLAISRGGNGNAGVTVLCSWS